MSSIPFYFGVSFVRDGKKYEADVQTVSLTGKPDCKIGNFGQNWWFRTRKALSTNFTGYGSLDAWHKAVRLSLIKRGCTDISFSSI